MVAYYMCLWYWTLPILGSLSWIFVLDLIIDPGLHLMVVFSLEICGIRGYVWTWNRCCFGFVISQLTYSVPGPLMNAAMG